MTRIEKLSVGAIKWGIRKLYQEYLTASAYFREIGAQTPSTQYGGSRSIVYLQLLEGAKTLKEISNARSQYTSLHTDSDTDDERGGLLRIVAHWLRWIPIIGLFMERRVRADDSKMRGAKFNYPSEKTDLSELKDTS